MDAELKALRRTKQKLLQQLAELELAEQRRLGLFDSVPHYSEIEDAGQNLGRLLSRVTQSRLANEVAAGEPVARACPGCGKMCSVEVVKRRVSSLDGPIEIMEPKADCPACRRAFFPSA